MLNLSLLKSICEVPGVSGFERRVRDLVLREVRDLVDEVEIDNMGNVLAIRRGKHPKRVMVAAHMDEIGFVVSHIDENGFLRFLPLGGFDPKTLTAQRVIVHGRKDLPGVLGCKPIHIMKPEERKNVIPITEYFVDTGLPKKEVEKWISVGD
ncbi:MAG: M42 family peptidase, partial [Bacteroidota bacterium]